MDEIRLNPIPRPESPTGAGRTQEAARAKTLDKACAEMESLFLNHLLKEMRVTVPDSGLLSRGTAGDIVDSMLDAELSRELALGGGVGLAETLLRQLEPPPPAENSSKADRGEGR